MQLKPHNRFASNTNVYLQHLLQKLYVLFSIVVVKLSYLRNSFSVQVILLLLTIPDIENDTEIVRILSTLMLSISLN